MEYWVEAETGARSWTLLADGKPYVATGFTVELQLTDNTGTPVPVNVSWLDDTRGRVEYAPSSLDLVAAKSPYRARFKVTNQANKDVYFPSQNDDVWHVRL